MFNLKTTTPRVVTIAIMAGFAILPYQASHAITQAPVKQKPLTSKQVEQRAKELEISVAKFEPASVIVPVHTMDAMTHVGAQMLRTQAQAIAKQELAVMTAQANAAKEKRAEEVAAAKVAEQKQAEAKIASDKQQQQTASSTASTSLKKSNDQAAVLLAQLKKQESDLKAGTALKNANKQNSNAPIQTTGNTTPLGKTTPAWLCQVPGTNAKTQEWPRVVAGRIKEQFPEVKQIGGWRPGSATPGSDHPRGLALDVMVPPSSVLGDDVARWSLTYFKELNLDYVIWKQHIWTDRQPYWRPMSDRGGITANHFDHPHLSFKEGAGTCPP